MSNGKCSKICVVILLPIITIGVLVSIALSAALFRIMNKRFDEIENKNDQTTSTTTAQPLNNLSLTNSINIEDLMDRLEKLQKIADESAKTRAIGTQGFDKTIDYIKDYFNNAPYNISIFLQSFSVQNFSIKGTPILILSINGNDRHFNYSTNLARSDFTYVNYSAAINLTQFNLVIIPNHGCDNSDWRNATNSAALVQTGGQCTNAEKGVFANKNNASALLFYNNGMTTSNLAPIIIRLRQANTLPALFLSYGVGQELINAHSQENVSISIQIERENYSSFSVNNICADIPGGNLNETILVGSHSDSVPAGPGINDNGSGTAANLVLAMNLARLYHSTNYTKYKYHVRFCWWGAEEIGLVGSIYHAQEAQNSSQSIGNRLNDYLINLNFDMLGSPNFMFGIYDARTAKNDTPSQALPGSNKTTELFKEWFDKQNLPWDYTEFSGRSDYGPFLAAGIVAGGLFSGAEGIKTVEQRDKYEKLGKGLGGFAGAAFDPCYHQGCDTIQNINQFGYEKMVQAAAYVLERLGQMDSLTDWLYPDGRPKAHLPDDYVPNSDYFLEIN